ncbi:MAG: divalent-cation tolerance protein CutA [Cyanobacteriota bacterium]
MTKYAVVLITVPGEEIGLKIAKSLVEKKLAACVNIVPGIRSIYSWEGKICDDKELLLIVKTKPAFFDELKNEVVCLHEYDVPEIILLPIEDGNRSYLQWIDENVSV